MTKQNFFKKTIKNIFMDTYVKRQTYMYVCISLGRVNTGTDTMKKQL